MLRVNYIILSFECFSLGIVSSGGLRGLSKVLRNAGFAIAGEIICQLCLVTCLQQLSGSVAVVKSCSLFLSIPCTLGLVTCIMQDRITVGKQTVFLKNN